MLERVLAAGDPIVSLDDADRRDLTPLFWSHVNPYGRFRLDLDYHLGLGKAA